jgi:ABC-type nitrate/sulfonate/bicarbonate transport system permease component
VGTASEFDRRFLAAMAALLVVLSFAYIFYVTIAPPASTTAQHYVDVILGFLLGTCLSTVVGFFFGASKTQAPPEQQGAVP